MTALKSFFNKHHSLWQPILLDIVALCAAIFTLLQLDAPDLIINSPIDVGVFILLNLATIYVFKGYHILLRYTSLLDIARILSSVFVATILFGIYNTIGSRVGLRYLVLLFYFSASALLAYRILVRLLFKETRPQTDKIKTLIFGAGKNGINAYKAFENSDQLDIIAFVDDHSAKVGKTIEGVKVFGVGVGLATFIKKRAVTQVLIATEHLSKKRKQALVSFLTCKN